MKTNENKAMNEDCMREKGMSKKSKKSLKVRIIDCCEHYVAPVAVLVAILTIMLLTACMWGSKTHWTVGILVLCVEVIAAVWVIGFVRTGWSDWEDD